MRLKSGWLMIYDLNSILALLKIKKRGRKVRATKIKLSKVSKIDIYKICEMNTYSTKFIKMYT